MKLLLTTVCLSFLLSCAAFAAPKYSISVLYKQGDEYYSADGMNNRNEVLACNSYGSPHLSNVSFVTRLITSKGVIQTFTGFPDNINDSGDVVGINATSPGCWIFRPSGPSAGLRALPAQFARVFINDSGTLAGTLNGNGLGFVYKDGLMHTFRACLPVGINNFDQVTGSWIDSSTPTSSTSTLFIYTNGKFTSVDRPPGVINVWPVRINDRGEVIGALWFQNEPSHPFLYANGQLADIGFPPGESNGGVVWINNCGQIVGNSTDADPEPWLYQNGQYLFIKDLVTPGQFYLYGAISINDKGQILMDGALIDPVSPTGAIPSTECLFLLTPTKVGAL